MLLGINKGPLCIATLLLLYSWNNPLLHCDLFLHNWKPGFIAGSHRENPGCFGMVSSLLKLIIRHGQCRLLLPRGIDNVCILKTISLE